jgi:hypothetical protein
MVMYLLQLSGKYGLLEFPEAYIAYAADLICLPILILLSERTMARILGLHHWAISGWMLVALIIYVSLVFEVLLPMASHRFVADPLDALCYAIGGGVYFGLRQNIRTLTIDESPSSKTVLRR